MKTLILVSILSIVALQAGDVVKYDTRDDKSSNITKPNHPNDDLYTK
ncbi:MAG: hypothetical protein U9R50_03435 [Campylobacterota bacterium]|nr:hypothetical protein [Campylobacterota bacterium]